MAQALARVLPDDDWRQLRLVVFVLSCGGLFVASSGFLVTHIFHDPTTIKYLATVLGFAFLAVLCTVRAPLRWAAALLIVAGPSYLGFTVQGEHLMPIDVTAILGVLLALPRVTRATGNVRRFIPLFVFGLLPGLVHSSSPSAWLVWLSLTVLSGWIVFEVACEEGGAGFVCAVFVGSGLLQALFALWEFKTKQQLYPYQTQGYVAASSEAFFQYGNLVRPAGTLPDPIGLGQFLAICLPVTIGFAAAQKRYWQTLALTAIAGVIALALALSLSRMSIVGGTVGVLLTLALIPKRTRVVGTVAVVTAIVVVLAVTLGGAAFTSRIASIGNPTSRSVRTSSGDIQREQLWSAAWRIGEHNLLAGVGLGNVTSALPRYGVPVQFAANAQNAPLQLFAEGGVLALLAIVAIVLAGLLDLARAWRAQTVWVAAAAGGLVGTLITWSTDVEIRLVQISAMVAALFGLIAALRTVADRAGPASTMRSIAGSGPGV